MPITPDEVFRDYNTTGVSASGVYLPKKAEIRSLLNNINSVNFYNVKKDFGALGDSATDDTAAIQTALNTVPYGGTLYFPAGFYKVLGTGAAALTRVDPINIIGDGLVCTGLFWDAAVPNTRDMFVLATINSFQGLHIHDIGFYAAGFGRHTLTVNGNDPNFIFQMHMHDVYIGASATGNSLRLMAVAYSTIERCNLESIKIESGGDGLTIRENVLGGTNGRHSIEAAFVGGAGGFLVVGNVIAGTAGGLVLNDVVFANIISNEFETPVGIPNTYGYIVDVGVTGQALSVHLLGNSYSVLPGTDMSGVFAIPIRIRATCISAVIRERLILGRNSIHIQDEGQSTFIDTSATCAVGTSTGPIAVSSGGLRPTFNMWVSTIHAASDLLGTDTASAQVWFPSGAITSVTLEDGKTYDFEGLLMVSKTAGTTSRTVGMSFGGTALTTGIAYEAIAAGADSTVFNGTQNSVSSYVITPANQTVFGIASTSANQVFYIKVRGRVRIFTGGSFIPQFKYSAAPGGAPIVQRDSFFRIWETQLYH